MAPSGFDEQAGRDNIEYAWNQNFIDPMRVNVTWWNCLAAYVKECWPTGQESEMERTSLGLELTHPF